MLGVMSTRDAQRMAENRGLDLVEITPNATPPVCKIMDYGKFKYEQSIREKQQRKAQKATQVKEINENAQDVKSVTITGNTFENANVAVSAAESVTFSNNAMGNGIVDIRSYSAENNLSVTAQGNTLAESVKPKVQAEAQESKLF